MTEPVPTDPPADAGTGDQTPPWGDDFDAEKAWKLVQNLREDNGKLKARPVLDDEARQRLSEYDRLVEASKTAEERANEEAARWQTEAKTWQTAAVASRVEALAAADFADPSDAASNLDPAKYLGSGGEIDQTAIKADLADLLARKPHYRRPDTTSGPRLPAPNPAQGTGGRNATPDPGAEFAAILQGQMNGSR